MENKSVIIGSGNTGKSAIEAFRQKGIDVIVIDNIEPDESFDLNGIKYAPIKTEQRKHKHVTPKLVGLISFASMIYSPCMMDMYGEDKYERKLPDGTDIVKEYGLIQNKISKLSKWERDIVVRIFEKNYYRVL